MPRLDDIMTMLNVHVLDIFGHRIYSHFADEDIEFFELFEYSWDAFEWVAKDHLDIAFFFEFAHSIASGGSPLYQENYEIVD